MDDRRFDALSKRLAASVNRRGAIKGLLGLGGAAAVVSVLGETESTEAQRRPTPTAVPTPQCPDNRVPCGSGCCCAPGFTTCGAECCPNGQAVCCDNACCYGTCFDEMCCAPGQRACNGACIPTGWCCGDNECVGARCLNGTCVPHTPTSVPTQTPTSAPPTQTPTLAPPTDTPVPTNTNVPSATTTKTPTPTNAPATKTPTPTQTVRPTRTPVCQDEDDCWDCICLEGNRLSLCPACLEGLCVGTITPCSAGTTCVRGHCVPITATTTPTSTMPAPTPTATPTGVLNLVRRPGGDQWFAVELSSFLPNARPSVEVIQWVGGFTQTLLNEVVLINASGSGVTSRFSALCAYPSLLIVRAEGGAFKRWELSDQCRTIS